MKDLLKRKPQTYGQEKTSMLRVSKESHAYIKNEAERLGVRIYDVLDEMIEMHKGRSND